MEEEQDIDMVRISMMKPPLREQDVAESLSQNTKMRSTMIAKEMRKMLWIMRYETGRSSKQRKQPSSSCTPVPKVLRCVGVHSGF